MEYIQFYMGSLVAALVEGVRLVFEIRGWLLANFYSCDICQFDFNNKDSSILIVEKIRQHLKLTKTLDFLEFFNGLSLQSIHLVYSINSLGSGRGRRWSWGSNVNYQPACCYLRLFLQPW